MTVLVVVLSVFCEVMAVLDDVMSVFVVLAVL